MLQQFKTKVTLKIFKNILWITFLYSLNIVICCSLLYFRLCVYVQERIFCIMEQSPNCETFSVGTSYQPLISWIYSLIGPYVVSCLATAAFKNWYFRSIYILIETIPKTFNYFSSIKNSFISFFLIFWFCTNPTILLDALFI